MERVTVLSADGHFGGTVADYRPYMDPAYRDLLEERDDLMHQNAIRGTRLGLREPGIYEVGEEAPDLGRDVKRRLAVQDIEGVAGELLIIGSDFEAPLFYVTNKPASDDVRAAGVRAYHRWLADAMSESDGRLLGVGYPGEIADLDASLRELEWVREHGFVSVVVPGNVRTNRPPLFDRYWDTFWAACADLGMVLNLHAGWGVPQGPVYEHFVRMSEGIPLDGELTDLEDFGKSLMEQMDADAEGSPFALDMTPRQTLWQLMLGGVFDRFPSLKMVLTEVRADWLPATLAHLDQRFASEALNLQLKPSEYFARNCGVTPSSHHRAEIELRHEIGIDQLMFGADIPHPESTFPDTKAWIGHSLSGVPEADARKILGENAIRIYGLDGPHFDQIASRIGPTVSEVTGGVELDERLVQHFDLRGGYLKPVEEVATDKIDERLVTDLARVGAG